MIYKTLKLYTDFTCTVLSHVIVKYEGVEGIHPVPCRGKWFALGFYKRRGIYSLAE
jgi:hypothetical protein